MNADDRLIADLQHLNRITLTLNQATDLRPALRDALADLVQLMGLESGWIFLADPSSPDRRWGEGFTLAAHYNLPPALALDQNDAWLDGCACQEICKNHSFNHAYNEVRCSRLASASGDQRGLAVHASAPLLSGEKPLGILNVAAKDWDAFTPRSLALLSNAGIQMGVALERSRLTELIHEQHIQEQASLLAFSNQLLSRLGLDDLMDTLVQEVSRLLDADACALVLPCDPPTDLAFRSASGWRRDPVALGRRMPNTLHTGPGQVMQTQQALLVNDLQTSDPTDWAPAWLREEGFRGHAVVPLIAQGRSIGTLIIDSRQARSFDATELRFLRLMANQAALALEKARLTEEEVQRRRLEDELAVGRRIQLSLLPDHCPAIPGWECAAIYRPAREVSGDFYDFFDLPGGDDRLGIVIADVADKGVPAALFMAMCRTTIRSTALSGRTPAQALQRANELILKDSRSDLFVSAFYAALCPTTGEFTYASAGHNRPYWFHSNGEMEQMRAIGTILGALEDIVLEERRVILNPGDAVVFYTDGVSEAMNPNLEPFGEKRLEQVLRSHAADSAEDISRAILQAVRAFASDSPQSDDLTLIVLRRLN